MTRHAPSPVNVELQAHDLCWAKSAASIGEALAAALGPILLAVHHVGSTAIPKIHAKLTIDLLPVVTSLSDLDSFQGSIQVLGYEWWGESGLSERRFCTRSDPITGRRLVHLHFYAKGSPDIIRHLAFRDYLLKNPQVAASYDKEKARCQHLYPDDSHAYSDCKNAWIKKVETEALDALRSAKK